ncbi:MAG: anhydro-N-acetylmuramic acid kinase, partial [Flavobacteriales bacterium CG_4_9_14_3_um_filter_32_8]
KLAQKLGSDFDDKGQLAKTGNINQKLLKKLNSLNYYKIAPPKSLGIEWIEKNIFPIIEASNISIEDQLRTFVEHIALQILKIITATNKNVLFTGGGTYNTFLMDCISNLSTAKIIIPSKEIIEFKEALIFAFLGVLRLRQEFNCLKSVTGAEKNSIGGCIYQPFL